MKNKRKFLGVLVTQDIYDVVERVAKANRRSKTYVAEKFLETGINTLESFVASQGINTSRHSRTRTSKSN